MPCCCVGLSGGLETTGRMVKHSTEHKLEFGLCNRFEMIGHEAVTATRLHKKGRCVVMVSRFALCWKSQTSTFQTSPPSSHYSTMRILAVLMHPQISRCGLKRGFQRWKRHRESPRHAQPRELKHRRLNKQVPSPRTSGEMITGYWWIAWYSDSV